MSMLWVGIGSTAVGAATSIYSANKASDAASKGGQQSLAYQREALQQQNQQSQPYREAGYTALDDLMMLVGLDAPQSVRSAAAGGDAGLRSNALGQRPDGTVAGTNSVREAFQTYLGRAPTPYELEYYTGKRSSADSPLRERAGELYDDIIKPGPRMGKTAWYGKYAFC